MSGSQLAQSPSKLFLGTNMELSNITKLEFYWAISGLACQLGSESAKPSWREAWRLIANYPKGLMIIEIYTVLNCLVISLICWLWGRWRSFRGNCLVKQRTKKNGRSLSSTTYRRARGHQNWRLAMSFYGQKTGPGSTCTSQVFPEFVTSCSVSCPSPYLSSSLLASFPNAISPPSNLPIPI